MPQPTPSALAPNQALKGGECELICDYNHLYLSPYKENPRRSWKVTHEILKGDI